MRFLSVLALVWAVIALNGDPAKQAMRTNYAVVYLAVACFVQSFVNKRVKD